MKPIKRSISYPLGIMTMKCPKCGKEITFMKKNENYGIKVNCETKGQVHIPDMWHIWSSCNNPLCEWSVVENEFG